MANIRQYISENFGKIKIWEYNITYPGVKEVNYNSTLHQYYDRIVFVQNQMFREVELIRSNDEEIIFGLKRAGEKNFYQYVLLVED